MFSFPRAPFAYFFLHRGVQVIILLRVGSIRVSCAPRILSKLSIPTTSEMVSLLFSIAGFAVPVVYGLTPLQTFYPPTLNDTSYITNATLGTYGGVYQSPTREANTSLPYGTYDYCQMPHPRAQEYPLPEAVKNGSVKANIVYLEYLQRHQRRTPYNILPGGEVSA